VNDDIPLRKNLLKWVIPSDTVIDINKAEGLLKNSKYRPARASLINHLMNQMDKNHIKLAKKIALNKPLSKKDNEIFENLDSNKKKFIYDMAYEYLQYYYQKSNGIKKSSMAKSSIKILKKRSKLSGTTNITKIKYPNTDPLLAHYPSKLSIKYGHNNIRGDFAKISTRSAYHDIMDSDDGFLKGAAINVVDFDFDYFFDEDRLKLDQFKLLDITSYSPRNILFKPLSWQLSVGVKNLYISNIDLKLSAFGNFGLGLNFDLDALNSNIIFLINGINYYGKHISTNNLSAIVPEIGIITNLGSKTKIRFTAKHNFFKQETKFNHSEYRISQNYELNKKINLEGYLNKKHYNHFKNDHEFGLGLKYYY
jgi:hypothetical protein